MKNFIKLTTIVLVTILLCSCVPKEKYVYSDMGNYLWIPERQSDYYYKIESFTDGVYVWGFDLKSKETEELQKSDKFHELSRTDVANIERNIFYEGIPQWWELSQNSVFYIYAPWKNVEITDTEFSGSSFYVYIWDVDADKYFCVYLY